MDHPALEKLSQGKDELTKTHFWRGKKPSRRIWNMLLISNEEVKTVNEI
jgi:hypothetical protein